MPDSIRLALTHTWQIALLFLIVWMVCRTAARNRPHLAHLLWLVVVLKCLTPPLWSSHLGVFCWLQATQRDGPPATLVADPTEMTPSPQIDHATWNGPRPMSVESHGEIQQLEESATVAISHSSSAERSIASHGWELLLWTWISTSAVVIACSTFKTLRCLRIVMQQRCPADPRISKLLGKLIRHLDIKRPVRLVVTRALIGPAVVGTIRPIILLPEVITRDRDIEQLEPILAHELLHIRRGDLWVGMLQVVAQGMWWFNPLVWLASRSMTWEAERCCDEEAIATLNCSPARYARGLLSILEQKRSLRPVPAFPGVRAVDITSQRLERIMKLGHGCHQRSPWWCWALMLALSVMGLARRDVGQGKRST